MAMSLWTECPDCEKRFKGRECPKCGWAVPAPLRLVPRWVPPPLSPLTAEENARAGEIVQAVLAGTLTAPQAQQLYDAMGW
jgi:hypothetical protein